MADTVDRAASSSPADGAAEPQDHRSRSLNDEAGEQEQVAEDAQPHTQVGEQADGGEPDTEQAEGGEPETEEASEEPHAAPALTELFEQLGRDLRELSASEAQLEAVRNMPDVRRAAREIAGTVVVVIAALTGFAFINVAALEGLSHAMATWLAALALAAVWLAVAGVLLFGFLGRVRQWLSWVVVSPPSSEDEEELKRERDAAGKAALSTVEQLGPALAAQIAIAAVPDVGDMAGGVVEMGDSVLDGADEIVEEVTERIPGGGVVNQVWSVALMPGRFGIKVATTVFQRGSPSAPDGHEADSPAAADDR